MTKQHSKQGVNLILGDCLEKMKDIPDNSVDSIVTDPPYGLSFMGKKWDYDVPSKEIWQEALRVLKPGGHLLAFAGTRTQHRMAVNTEDAGFEIRDMIAWVYGSGFPKSHNVGKAVKAQRETGGSAPKNLRQNRMGTDYQPTGQKDYRKGRMFSSEIEHDSRIEIIENEWEGWGSALKPALEPITLARKPLSEKNIALNCLKWGVGGINIDGCRVEYTDGTTPEQILRKYTGSNVGKDSPTNHFGVKEIMSTNTESTLQGRFPANLIHDGSEEVLSLFPSEKDKSPARFFYCAKASKSERNTPVANFHPTVKPVKLMQYLVRLITPPGGVVLDPFMGSGTTGVACKNLNRSFIGIELDPEYFEIAKSRIENTLERLL